MQQRSLRICIVNLIFGENMLSLIPFASRFLQKFQIFPSPNPSKQPYKNQFFAGFCSFLNNAELSEWSSKNSGKKKKPKSGNEGETSRVLSYLVSSCGLSQESAASVSEKVSFKDAEKSISIITFLEKHGFSKPQIAKVVMKRPWILLTQEKTLLPKMEFFQSIGMPNSLVALLAARDPTFLFRSLEKKLIPNYNFLKGMLLTDEKVASAVKRTSWVFLEDIRKRIIPNIEVLKEFDVPDPCIRLLLAHYPEVLMKGTDELRATISEVQKMGFNPLKTVFVLALHALSADHNKASWDRCYEIYSKWGWSEDDIYSAFRKHPNCMMMSEQKLTRTMDFLVNKMGWDSKSIANSPSVLLFNLENRIIPRCSVIRVLMFRKIGNDPKLSTFLLPSEKCFLKRFVSKYADEIPELHDLYKGKVAVEDLL